ncbi:MAG: Do family serine endopeptidase [bacterium]
MNSRPVVSSTGLPRFCAFLFVAALVLGPTCVTSTARSADMLKEMSQAFAEAAKKVAPAVVHINTSAKVETSGRQSFEGVPPNHPLAPFLKDFFDFDAVPRGRGDNREKGEEMEDFEGEQPIGLGSGIIVSSDGYILTNYHVIKDADKIEVIVEQNGHSKTYQVSDPPRSDIASDLAVIKIEASGLPAAQFGDSDKLEVGEWVLAIGNPFGLDQSVTSGIISYIGRPRGSEWFGSFIQTDAAINPGNSGGPLVNLDGEVVGINNMIATGGPFERSYAGVGFTIPGNLAKQVKDDLIEKGEVVRGYLGVLISPVDEEYAKYNKLESQDGALVQNVGKDTPAEKASLKVKDIIVEYDGKPVKDSSDLQAKVAATKPDTKVRVTVLRPEGDTSKKKNITVTIGTRPQAEEIAASKEKTVSPSRKLGMTVQNLSDSLAEQLNYEPGSGVLVTNVQQLGPAAREGIQRYDLIREVNHEKVKDISDFEKAIAKREDAALLVVERRGDTFIAVIEMK